MAVQIEGNKLTVIQGKDTGATPGTGGTNFQATMDSKAPGAIGLNTGNMVIVGTISNAQMGSRGSAMSSMGAAGSKDAAFGAGANALPGGGDLSGGSMSVGGGTSAAGGTGVGGGAIGAAAGGDGQSQLLNATKQMQETQMSFNLQYLQLQSQMQHENRSYTAVSNIMKTKHDTVKNSISNIR